MNLRDQLIRLGTAEPNLRVPIRRLLTKMALRTLGSVASQEVKRIEALIDERMEVDWVTDKYDPKWRDVEDATDARARFEALNERIFKHLRDAAREFYAFLKNGRSELEPFGVKVKVGRPQYFSVDPEEWVAPEFAFDIVAQDQVEGKSHKIRYRVDARTPLSVEDVTHDINFMASSPRDNNLTAGDLIIQSMHPRNHLKRDGLDAWRERRRDT